MFDGDLSLEKLVPVACLTIFDVLHLHPQPVLVDDGSSTRC
jgi:hypothetical protein